MRRRLRLPRRVEAAQDAEVAEDAAVRAAAELRPELRPEPRARPAVELEQARVRRAQARRNLPAADVAAVADAVDRAVSGSGRIRIRAT